MELGGGALVWGDGSELWLGRAIEPIPPSRNISEEQKLKPTLSCGSVTPHK